MMTRWSLALLAGIVSIGIAAYLSVNAIQQRQHFRAPPGEGSAARGSIQRAPDMVWISGGSFLMGNTDRLSNANERPAHQVRIRGFWMDRTPVTNKQFAAFVAATKYVTAAERSPIWETLKAQLPPGTPRPSADVLVPGAMVFVGTELPVTLDDPSQWWRYLPGASWHHPQGPGSSIDDKGDHPVVHVAYDDALAYARWVGKRLPTEAEWEFAARGRLEQEKYAWGDEFEPRGRRMANVWDDSSSPFPVVSSQAERSHGTSPVCSFPLNGYGLCDMTGNVWQWVADRYRADAYSKAALLSEAIDPTGPNDSYDPEDAGAPSDAPKRVIRGGSFLCSEGYCLSYRPSARRGADPYTSTSHIGFRLVCR